MENQIEQAERVSSQHELPLRPKEVRLRTLEDVHSRPLFRLIPHHVGNVPIYLYIDLQRDLGVPFHLQFYFSFNSPSSDSISIPFIDFNI